MDWGKKNIYKYVTVNPWRFSSRSDLAKKSYAIDFWQLLYTLNVDAVIRFKLFFEVQYSSPLAGLTM